MWGGMAKDNRRFLNAVFWILRSGAPWRDLPPDLGDWKNTQRRFCRWRDKGLWESLLAALVNDPDYEWLMMDAPHINLGLTVWAEIYLNRELVWERRMARARLVERPFFAPERRRLTPPADY